MTNTSKQAAADNVVVQVSMTREQRSQLRAVAALTGTTTSECVRGWIVEQAIKLRLPDLNDTDSNNHALTPEII